MPYSHDKYNSIQTLFFYFWPMVVETWLNVAPPHTAKKYLTPLVLGLNCILMRRKTASPVQFRGKYIIFTAYGSFLGQY